MGANGSKDASSRSSSLQSIHLKNKPQDLVDFGTVFPNGLYSTTPQDFDTRKLRQLILTRKISPFYTGKYRKRKKNEDKGWKGGGSMSMPSLVSNPLLFYFLS